MTFFVEHYKTSSSFISVSCIIIMFLVMIVINIYENNYDTFDLYINGSDNCFLTKRFLSFSIDSSQIGKGLHNPSLKNNKVKKLISYLKGGYLRVGGNAADLIIFRVTNETSFEKGFYRSNITPIYMSEIEWNELNEFSVATGLKLLFDLNVLIRSNDSWDYTNAQLIFNYSNTHHYNIDWELGNEPNSFRKEFGIFLPATQLASDYSLLKSILLRDPSYNTSLLVGPSISNPDKKKLEHYLLSFLSSHPNLDVISFHHYYGGPDATLDDLINPTTYESVKECCLVVQEVIKKSGIKPKPVWITETGSTYGGGSELSDKFVSSFLWLDKLGVAATQGVQVVVRQSLFNGVYSLIDKDSLVPHPDYWVSVLYRRLVGRKVLKVDSPASHVRVYAHCSPAGLYPVLYGINIDKKNYFTKLPYDHSEASAFILQGLHSLTSKVTTLNGEELKMKKDWSLPPMLPVKVNLSEPILLPSYSTFFFTIHYNSTLCV